MKQGDFTEERIIEVLKEHQGLVLALGFFETL